MQRAQGAPGDMVPVVEVGLLPMAGRASAGTGTSMVIWRRNFPSVSKTWMRRVARGGPETIFLGAGGVLGGGVWLAGLLPGFPPRFFPLPSFFAFSVLG